MNPVTPLDLSQYDYQFLADTMNKIGNQFNKPAYRFLKGECIGYAMEKVTGGRLRYVDQEGYDSIDDVTGLKYEYKSTYSMFENDLVTGRVTLANTNKGAFARTFDYLLCIQTNPNAIAIAQLTWDECNSNHKTVSGQFNLTHKVPVTNWVCKNNTTNKNLPLVDIKFDKMWESIGL